ncbi:MAG: nitrite reductase small subunit NirD [Elusimicrobiota bacterium]
MSEIINKNIHWVPVANKNLIPKNEGRKVIWGKKKIAIFNLGDEFLAVDNQCPHKQGPLADGITAGKAVYCPLHNWKIDLKTGCTLAGGEGKVKSYPVMIKGSDIYIGFETVEKDIQMKEILAIIRPNKWGETKKKLTEIGVNAFTQRRVYGRGKQKGLTYRANKNEGPSSQTGIQFIPKRMILIVVPESQVKLVVNGLIEVNQTGAIGDGKIFISQMNEVILIRTGEKENQIKEIEEEVMI